MSRHINSASIGALVRKARLAAGLSQTELGQRIGASRFWVAQFEKGKPTAELGLALKAVQAVGLRMMIEPEKAKSREARAGVQPKAGLTSLESVLARTTLASAVSSSVVGWPTLSIGARPSRKRRDD